MKSQISKKSILKDEKGLVLVVTLLLLSVLVIMGTTAIMAVSTDIKIAGNYRQNQIALYNAEAGVEQVINYLRTHTVNYPTVDATQSCIDNGNCNTSQYAPITVTVPTGFLFASSVNIYGYNIANKKYVFRMTGTGAGSASKTIEAYIERDISMDAAVAMYGGGPDVKFKTGAGGGYNIDGHDYPVPASATCSGSGCETTAPADAPLPGLATVETPDLLGDYNAHLGGTTPPDSIVPSRDAEWTAYVDYIITNNLYQTTLGTRAAPAITLVPNGSTFNGTGNGAGIIIVDNGGIIDISGNFCYEGIIILRGSGTVTGNGSGYVYGSLITISHAAKLIDVSGSVNINYSSAAIANVSNLSGLDSLKKPRQTAWRDIL